MSRYLLVPNSQNNINVKYDSVTLLPMDEFNGQIKNVDIPKGILKNFLSNKSTIKKNNIINMLTKFSKANIRRNKDGQIMYDNKLLDFDFNDFVNDSCCRKFSKYYEPIYCMLRENDITF